MIIVDDFGMLEISSLRVFDRYFSNMLLYYFSLINYMLLWCFEG